MSAGRSRRLIREFADYLAEAFACAEIVQLAAERDGSARDFARALVICDDFASVDCFASAMATAPVGVLVCDPEATIPGPRELARELARRGLHTALAGWAPAGDDRWEPQLIAVLEGKSVPVLAQPPEDFRVVAFLPVYNESDIISHTLEYLTRQGISVYLLDNWSSDDTFERARAFTGRGLVGLERFPPNGPVETYEWRQMLGRVEDLAAHIDADWFVLHDADERRHAPWPGVDLKAGLHHVDRSGFTSVDHVVVNFWPTGDDFDLDRDVEEQLRYFSVSDHPGHYHQRKAWKNCGCSVSLAASAGHDVRFPGRLVYPFKFLLKHYPLRSEEHGRRKVLMERAPRWNRHERALGWHRQYDDVVRAGTFLGDPAALEYFEEAAFEEEYFVERLSGVGVFDERPHWATGPRQRF